MTKIAISGFGRIGRAVARIIFERPGCGLEIAGVNDLVPLEALANLLKYDSVQGRFPGIVEVKGNNLIINGEPIPVSSIKNPNELPWKALGVKIVAECTGVFTKKEGEDGKPGYGGHVVAGAEKVVLSAPAKDDIQFMGVMGVNDDLLTPNVVFASNASCTTNCLAPLAKVLHEAFGIQKGLMTTAHAYTASQGTIDSYNRKDARRGRAAGINMFPTTTGAAKAIGKVIPALDGKLNGIAIRVPIPVGSVVDLTVELGKEVIVEEVNAAVEAAADGVILDYCEDPIVSSDIIHNPASSIFDSLATMVIGKRMIKVLSWYDNEWGYSNRMVDMMAKMAKMLP